MHILCYVIPHLPRADVLRKRTCARFPCINILSSNIVEEFIIVIYDFNASE